MQDVAAKTRDRVGKWQSAAYGHPQASSVSTLKRRKAQTKTYAEALSDQNYSLSIKWIDVVRLVMRSLTHACISLLRQFAKQLSSVGNAEQFRSIEQRQISIPF